MNTPPPPRPEYRPPVAVFYHTPAELAFVAVDKITSISVLAPPQIAPDAVWRVRVTMGADAVVREFSTEENLEEARNNICKAFVMARDDAVVFARELAAHLNAMKERHDARPL
jgi:hypothetical protein